LVGIQGVFDELLLAKEACQAGAIMHPSFPGSPEKSRDENSMTGQ